MATRSFRQFVEQELGKFPHFVIYALLEWVMIILLFVDGFLAFMCTEYAEFFELRIPCLLCSRIDHILVHRNSNSYYNDTICEAHKRDISSLAYCHVHRKLSDIRTMCEGCLLSFATERESDPDTYKSVVGILHNDIDGFAEDDPRALLKPGRKDEIMQERSGSIQRCSCCGEPLKMRRSPKIMARNSSINSTLLSQAPAPSPRAPFMTWRNEESRNLELPHVRYTELKFVSDNESELPEDDDGPNPDIQRESCKEDSRVTAPLLSEIEDMNDDACKTPIFARGNRFFGIPLTDSAAASPRFASRLSKRFPLDKPELLFDNSDLNATNETDGDILNRLKRQVRLDRKSLVALYMELDEERSASAVAANNAMAMITRLQAEKAAVQMEALQYQRMMEEQAEYDQEALQVMKGLLTKREQEIKVLEAEIEVYREKYGDINRTGHDDYEGDAIEEQQELKSQSYSSMSESESPGEGNRNRDFEPSSEQYEMFQEENEEMETTEESLLDFQIDKANVLGLSSDLETTFSEPPVEESIPSVSNTEPVNSEKKEKEIGKKARLTRQTSHIRNKLKTGEADSGSLKHSSSTLQNDGEETTVLGEMSHSSRKLGHLVDASSEDTC